MRSVRDGMTVASDVAARRSGRRQLAWNTDDADIEITRWNALTQSRTLAQRSTVPIHCVETGRSRTGGGCLWGDTVELSRDRVGPGCGPGAKVLRESLVVCGGSGQAASSSRMVRRL